MLSYNKLRAYCRIVQQELLMAILLSVWEEGRVRLLECCCREKRSLFHSLQQSAIQMGISHMN